MVRRPGNSLYDLIGAFDLTTDDEYYERGINLLHGFLTEWYVEKPDFLINVPAAIQRFGSCSNRLVLSKKALGTPMISSAAFRSGGLCTPRFSGRDL